MIASNHYAFITIMGNVMKPNRDDHNLNELSYFLLLLLCAHL